MRLIEELELLGQEVEDRARRVMTEAGAEWSEFASRAGQELQGLCTEARVDLADWESRAREGFQTIRVRIADLLEESARKDPAERE